MAELSVCVGRACRSKAGRDKGRYFLIYQIVDEQYVLLVDGVVRKMAKPKRKKSKHLELKPFVAESIERKWAEGVKVFDAEINSALHALGYNDD